MMWANRLLCVLAVTFTATAGEWIKITSPNFELYTTAGERTGKSAIKHFEQVRSFFLDFMKVQSHSVNKVRLVGFSSDKEFAPYKPNEVAAAFYMPTPDRDYIVMGDLSEQFFKIAVHEYVHLIMKHADAKAPVWLNEGIADFYSTMTPVAKKVRIGLFEPGRHYTLMQEKWMPLERLLAVSHDSPEYNEKNRASVFYAESWALVHMMYFDEGYRANSQRAFNAVLNGQKGAEVLPAIYGKSLEQIQKDLGSYLRKSWQTVAHVDSRLDAKVETPLVEKANPADAELTLAHVLNSGKKADQAAAMYAKIVAQYPDNIEALEALGYSHMRKNEDDDAMKHFGAATKLGSKNARMLRNYAYLLQTKGGSKTDAIGALRQALEVEPDYFDVRLQLGYLLMGESKFGEAYSLFAQVKSIKTEKAAALFKAQTYCLIRLNSFEQAREMGLRAKKYAKSESDVMEIDRNLSFIEYQLARGKAPAAPAAAAAGPATAASVPADRPAETLAALPSDKFDDVRFELEQQLSGDWITRQRKNQDTFFTGKFEELICSDKGAILRVSGEGKAMSLMIGDPEMVRIKGVGAETIDMQCGKQSPVRVVTVGFGAPEKGEKADGIVGSIEFQ